LVVTLDARNVRRNQLSTVPYQSCPICSLQTHRSCTFSIIATRRDLGLVNLALTPASPLTCIDPIGTKLSMQNKFSHSNSATYDYLSTNTPGTSSRFHPVRRNWAMPCTQRATSNLPQWPDSTRREGYSPKFHHHYARSSYTCISLGVSGCLVMHGRTR